MSVERPTIRNAIMEKNVWRVYLHNYSGKKYNVGLFWGREFAKLVADSLFKLPQCSCSKEFTVVSYTKESVLLTKMSKGWAEVYPKTGLVDYVRSDVLSDKEYVNIQSHWREVSTPPPAQSKPKKSPLKKQRTEEPSEALKPSKELLVKKTDTPGEIAQALLDLSSSNIKKGASSSQNPTLKVGSAVEK